MRIRNAIKTAIIVTVTLLPWGKTSCASKEMDTSDIKQNTISESAQKINPKMKEAMTRKGPGMEERGIQDKEHEMTEKMREVPDELRDGVEENRTTERIQMIKEEVEKEIRRQAEQKITQLINETMMEGDEENTESDMEEWMSELADEIGQAVMNEIRKELEIALETEVYSIDENMIEQIVQEVKEDIMQETKEIVIQKVKKDLVTLDEKVRKLNIRNKYVMMQAAIMLQELLGRGTCTRKYPGDTGCTRGEKGIQGMREHGGQEVCSCKPKDCHEAYKNGARADGIYRITTRRRLDFEVRCDMNTDGGGWTVVQRRREVYGETERPSGVTSAGLDFSRTWQEYKEGFTNGDELWLGNQRIYEMMKCSGKKWTMRIQMQHSDTTEHAQKVQRAIYIRNFRIGDESTKYRLSYDNITGADGGQGFCSDMLDYHNNTAFSTKDQDNDVKNADCSIEDGGGAGWWYRGCSLMNLNSMKWQTYGYIAGTNSCVYYRYLSGSVMMLRPEQ